MNAKSDTFPYWCSVCDTPIQHDEADNRHTADGEDCHAECCPFCKPDAGH